MVTNAIKTISTIKLGSITNSLIAPLAPTTNNILNMLDPITFPIANWFSPFLRAVSEVTSSGSEVPIATIVKPTNFSLIPNAIAIAEALFTTKSPPKTIPAIPIRMKTILFGRLNVGVSTSLELLSFLALRIRWYMYPNNIASNINPSIVDIFKSIARNATKSNVIQIRNGKSCFKTLFSTFNSLKSAVIPIINKYGYDLDGFEQSCLDLGGTPCNVGDKGFEFDVFPKISIRVGLWEGEDEIAPGFNMLFNKNVQNFMHVESAIGMGMYIGKKILKKNISGLL